MWKPMAWIRLLTILGAVSASAGEAGASSELRLKELGLTLPAVPKPVASYVPAVRTGNLLFLAGTGPFRPDGTLPSGKVGREFTTEQGAQFARDTCLVQLAVIKSELGSLDRVTRIVKVLGMVNATEDFREHPKVINGCSDLLVAVFGEKGRHARSAVGMGSLPFGIPVEVEVVVEFKD